MMVSTVYQTNKKTGVVHAYSSESYRDPVTKKPRTRRTYLGRVDPVTKMIIPKAAPGSRNRTKLSVTQSDELKLPPEISELIAEQTKAISEMREELDLLKAKNREMAVLVKKLNEVSEKMLKVLD
ncbi:hypothetical protein [Succinimonas amylolytica]|uniref:hypothetical protein n=1 Tax=Succinimonas amylolytica TaxID=83769 RepID=UPI0023A8D473